MWGGSESYFSRTCETETSHLTYLVGAVEVTNSLRRALDLDLPGTLIYDYPTIASLTKHVVSLLPSTGKTDSIGQNIPPMDAVNSMAVKMGTAKDLSKISGQADILKKVQNILIETLGVEINADQPFSAAGLDSLAAVEVSNSLNRYGIHYDLLSPISEPWLPDQPESIEQYFWDQFCSWTASCPDRRARYCSSGEKVNIQSSTSRFMYAKCNLKQYIGRATLSTIPSQFSW